jgi:hypothetical protein
MCGAAIVPQPTEIEDGTDYCEKWGGHDSFGGSVARGIAPLAGGKTEHWSGAVSALALGSFNALQM